MSHLRFPVVSVLALLLAAAPIAAQANGAGTVAAPQSLVAGVPDSATLSSLRFRSLGPAIMSGRISDIAVPAASRAGERLGKTVYVASAAGGVWKSVNAGMNWTPIFDDQRVSSIGSVAVAPSDPDVVWVGTGESNNLRSSSWGDGVYRSGDGGTTWTHMGLPESQHVPRIVVHPTDPDIVFVASMGPLWAEGGERGLYRTRDGGRTWRAVKELGPWTGFTDVALDPRDPDIVYAVSYQRERKAYSFVAGGPESGIWKSTDGGDTWTPLTEGLPGGDVGRIGIDIARSRPNTLYATVHAEEGGIFRSDDAGLTWTRTAELQSIPWFFGQIRVNPRDAEQVYHLGVQLQVSDDGGRTFRRIAANTHADHHAMWIDPSDPDHLIIGNDGGLYFSYDRGETWDFAVNLPVSTFYAVGVDMRDPYWVYGGLQDNGTWGAPVRTLGRSGPGNPEWIRAGGGDGFYTVIDPTDHTVVFLESQNGGLRRVDMATGEGKSIRPVPEEGEAPYRYNWSAPLLISPHDHRTLYFGANYLFRSTDRGDTWEKLGGDLTRALDRDILPIMGLNGPGGLGRHDGTAEFGNLSTIDESPLRRGLLYAGTDDGLLQVTRDGGRTWTRIDSFPGVPRMTYVSRVVASAHDEGTAYITLDGHRSNDFAPYVLRTTDYGRTFESITGGLPEGSVYVIREHARNPDVLFVGAEYGVFVSIDRGASWSVLDNGIGPAPVHDLVLHPRDNDLVVGTHGRGIYVLDDITPLERLADAAGTATAVVFEPRPATIHHPRPTTSLPGNRTYATSNPPSGATLTYWMPPDTRPDVEARLVVLDGSGDVVRELPAPVDPGIHRVQWDLRHEPPPAVQSPRGNEGGDDEEERTPRQRQLQGPWVLPGTYAVELQLSADGGALRTASRTRLQVRRDPAVALSAAGFRDLHETRMRAYRLQVRTQELVARLETAKRDVEEARVRQPDVSPGTAPDGITAGIDSLLLRLRPGPRRGGAGGGGGVFVGGGAATAPAAQPILTRVTGVASAIGGAHFLPTPKQRAVLDEAEADLERVAAAADDLLRTAPANARR